MKIKQVIPGYINYLQTLGRSPSTIKNAWYGLRHLIRFLESESIMDIEQLTFDVLKDYQEDLSFYLTRKGRTMGIESQSKILSVVKGFTRYLRDQDYVIRDPGERLKLPKLPRRLPKVILSTREIKTLLNAQPVQTNLGYRDRIILEILYDTAIRRSEIVNIKLSDIDADSGYIKIRGKGNKERVVPLSTRVSELVKSYILFIRPVFIKDTDKEYLIPGRWGERMDVTRINDIVRSCVRRSGIKKRVTTHTFRHTCATHMLRNGAPLRHVQEMLGHASIETTQVYTRVTINDLKKVHSQYHPGEQETKS